MHDAQKDGSISWYMGKVDPEAEGYDGKAYSRSSGTIDGDQFSGMGNTEWGGFGSPIGSREETHGTGGVTTQTERGYTVQHQPWNMIDEGADIGIPNQQGSLATGGTLNVATEGMDASKLPIGAVRSMLGLGGGGPTGKDYIPSATWKDGKFQMADLYDYSKMHPMIWRILKGLGNTVLPGAASAGDAFVQLGVPRGIGDGQPGNASLRRLQPREGR